MLLLGSFDSQRARLITRPRLAGAGGTRTSCSPFEPEATPRRAVGAGHRAVLYQQVLRAIAVHRVADRPDRFEPRMTKRRPKRYDRLTKPRKQIKRQMLERFSKI